MDLQPCADDPAFLCGSLRVPLNRRHPDGRMVNLHVEVFPHTDASAKPEGAILVTEGGPGYSISTTGSRYNYAFFLLADAARTKDLVMVDQRGVGQSQVIDCPAWQAGGPFYASAAACHDQLGDTANLYSTTDVADDLDDVRKALGYNRVDLVGGSYAGTDMLTYTVRHKKHVRAVVLGAPVVNEGSSPFYAEGAEAIPVMVDKLCRRSPACAAAHRDPSGSLAWLAKRLRHQPVRGTGIDAAGNAHKLTVTEATLATVVPWYFGGSFEGLGTIAQAAAALRRGDSAPLLRLVANATPPDYGWGPVEEMSAGHNLARNCVETPLAWDRGASSGVRKAQYEKALAQQPAFFGVLAKSAWAVPGHTGWQPHPCIASAWQYRPNYPKGTKVTGVPSLVIGGDYDLDVVESVNRLATKVLVGAKYVTMKAAGHVPWWWSDCGPQLVQTFLATHDPGDTSCASKPTQGWWLPGDYPASVSATPPAKQISGPGASASTRRLVTATVWTLMDGLLQNQGAYSMGTPDSVGLRGGSVHVDFDPDEGFPILTYAATRFVRGLAVSGTMTWTDVFDGDVTARLGGGSPTTMRVSGPIYERGGLVTVTLNLGGRPATFTVPGY